MYLDIDDVSTAYHRMGEGVEANRTEGEGRGLRVLSNAPQKVSNVLS